MIDLEKSIERFIRVKINSLEPRDSEYALKFLKDELEKVSKCIDGNKEIQDLYHKYLLGNDVINELNTIEFYKKLPAHKYPELFKITNTGTNWSDIPDVVFQIDIIPAFRKKFIRATKEYIVFKEFEKWVERFGIEKIQENRVTVNPDPNIELTNQPTKLELKIEEHLSPLYVEIELNDFDVSKVKDLLTCYFNGNDKVQLEEPIFIKNGYKKKLAFAMGEIYKSLKNDPHKYEFLLIIKSSFLFYKNEKLDEKTFNKSNLYKYMTTAPQ